MHGIAHGSFRLTHSLSSPGHAAILVLAAAGLTQPAAAQDAFVVPGVRGPAVMPTRAEGPWASALGPAVGAPPARVLLSNLPGSATSSVPGLSGILFEPGTGTGHFDRVYGDPSGHWVLTALSDLPSSENECVLVDGQLLIREGDPAPWTGGAESCGTIDQRCAVNAAGEVVFATNTSGTSNDDHIVRFSAGQWESLAQEAGPVPGLAGATLDDAIDSPLILGDGAVGYAADGVDGVASAAEGTLLVLANQVLLQSGVSRPSGVASGPTEAIENLDLGRFWASSDGSHWLVQGDLEGATTRDDVVVVDGGIVLREDSVIPGSGFAEPIDSAGIFSSTMDGAGHWYARGDNDGTNDDWVVRDGALLAAVGTSAVHGGTEVWSDSRYGPCFFGATGNGIGNWIVGGLTDEADVGRDAVLVLDGLEVVLREGDALDLDGDGLGDGVFIDTFGDDDLTLSDDLTLRAVVTVKDATGARVGQALIERRLEPVLGTPVCDGLVNSTGGPATLVATGSATVALGDLDLIVEGAPAGASTVFLISASTGSVSMPVGSIGTLCLGGAIERFLGPGEVGEAGPDGRRHLAVDLGALPTALGPAAGAPGETWHFQAWYRDAGAGAGATSNFSGARSVTLR